MPPLEGNQAVDADRTAHDDVERLGSVSGTGLGNARSICQASATLVPVTGSVRGSWSLTGG
jgi:hypothetical protein